MSQSALRRRRWASRQRTREGWLAAGAIALAGAALVNNWRAREAERTHPARGVFVTSDGVRLHYIERGIGQPVVFLHGNGVTVEDFVTSGLFDAVGGSYRAVAFDRPGFGHSERPRDRSWSSSAQAALLPQAFALLGIEKPIIVGHSWGTMVALALALDHPESVSGLVLASGYYYPTARADVAVFSPSAIPLLGDVLRYTVAPFIGQALAPALVAKMFAPQLVPQRFARDFPLALTLRPSQIRAEAEDAAHMITSAKALSGRYPALSCPVAILAGDADPIVDHNKQARRLHEEVRGSTLDIYRGTGHMIHHVYPERLVLAIDAIAARTRVPATEVQAQREGSGLIG